MLLPINEHLKKSGNTSLLVHWGSWEYEPGRPKEEHINGLLCRDISYYKTRFIYNVLKKEKPDCVVILTTSLFIDRAKILAASALGIPSVYLMCGIVAATDHAIDSQIKILESNFRRKRFTKIPKHLWYIFPNYFYSGLRKDPYYLFRPEPYKVIYNTFRFPEKWKMYPAPSRELQCDLCLAWGQVYKNFMVKSYGYTQKTVIVTGHPPLDSACELLNSPPDEQRIKHFLGENHIDPSKPHVVYIEGQFVKSKYEGWTNESLLDHLVEIADLCDAAGKTLVIKLHPNVENKDWLKEKIGARAVILQNTDSNMLLFTAESVIGHSSTLINTAIVFKKPVFIPRWGISGIIPPNYDNTGAVSVCNEPTELLEGLRNSGEKQTRLQSCRNSYIKDYLEPLDGRSQQRICDAIEQIAMKTN